MTRAASDRRVMIGIDVGTTSVRAIAFDESGTRLAAAARPTPIRTVEGGGEYDPDAIYDAVLAALCSVGEALAGQPVAGLAVASIGESCVLIDEAGRPLAPSIAWFDERTRPEAEAFAAAFGEDRVFSISGNAPLWIFTLSKLAWMRRHWPDAMAAARRVLMIADWIAFRLSGEAATDPSLASRTLYYDLHRRRWADEILEAAAIDPRLPAPLAASGSAVGEMRPEVRDTTGLAGRPVVGVGGHDHVVGSFAAGLAEPGILVDSIGTAEALMLATGGPLDNRRVYRQTYVQGAIETDRQMSYLGGGIHSAGGAMEWLRAAVGNPPSEELIAEAASVPAGCGGVVFLPHLVNAPAPIVDPHARGAFVGLTPAAGRGTFYRAVLEGLAMQSRLMLDGMTAFAGVGPVRARRIIGGASRNRLFLKIKANVYGAPVTVVEEPEATALGAALLGGIAAGVFPNLEVALAGLRRRELTVAPDADATLYDELRRMVFEGIHDSLAPINRRIAALAGSESRRRD